MLATDDLDLGFHVDLALFKARPSGKRTPRCRRRAPAALDVRPAMRCHTMSLT